MEAVTVASHVEYNRFTTGNFSIQEHVTTANFVIYIVELLFCLIACPANIMFIAVLANTSCVHKNLRMLLISTCVSDVIYAISRYMILVPLLVAYLFNTEISSIGYCWFAKSVHHVVVAVPGVTLFVIVVERSLASYLYATYETQSCYQYGLLLTGFQWIYAFILVITNQVAVAGTPRPYSRLPCQIEYSTATCIAVFIVIAIILNIIAITMFFKMIKFNRKMFRQRSFKLKNLSEIYQIAENVKSISLLYPILVTIMIGNAMSIFLVSITAVVYFLVRETPESQRSAIMTMVTGRGNEISQAYDICAILTKIAFCYAIKTHPALYKKWYTMFCHIKINPKKGSEEHDVKGLDGKKLTFTVIEETQHHFDSLAELWK